MPYDRFGQYYDDGDDDDDRGHSHGGGKPMDAGSALKEKVGINREGKLQLFSKSIDVGGKEVAVLLQPVVTTVLNEVSMRGAATAGRYGTAAAELLMPRNHAAKVGKGFYYTWLFGLSAADVALGIKKTVQDGFKQMYALRDQAQPLLAANNDLNTSIGTALTSKFTVLANARAKIYENGRHNLFGTMAGSIRALPTIAMGIYQSKLDNIRDPRRILQSEHHKAMSSEEKTELRAKMKDLKSKQPEISPEEKATLNAKIASYVDQAHQPGITKERRTALLKAARELRVNYPKRSFADTGSATEKEQNDILSNMKHWWSDPGFKRRMLHPANAADYYKNIKDLQLMPALATAVGGIVDRNISGKEAEEVAWDKIIELQQMVEKHSHHLDRDRVVVKVKDVFRKHACDLGKTYQLEGKSYDAAVDAIADAIVRDKLHPQALAEILDNKKIVTFGKDDADFGDVEDVKEQLGLLVDKYNSKISQKEVYKNAPFTKETLVATFKDIPEDEKPFFVMLFPPGILEKAGVDKKEVKKYRHEGKQQFVDQLTDMTRVLIGMGHEELKKQQGIRSRDIDAMTALEEGFRRADRDGEAQEYIRENLRDTTKMVRDIAASAKKPGELWKEFVARKESGRDDLTPKSPADHASRASRGESGDEVQI